MLFFTWKTNLDLCRLSVGYGHLNWVTLFQKVKQLTLHQNAQPSLYPPFGQRLDFSDAWNVCARGVRARGGDIFGPEQENLSREAAKSRRSGS
jgi:hypothetical protein